MLSVPKLSIKKHFQSIAVLTSGGDAPGMNAAIRAVIRYGIFQRAKMYGIAKGFTGLLEGEITEMKLHSVANIIQRGGTILKTSRCEAFYKRATRREAANILSRKGIEALIVIGGDGSFAGAHLMQKETGYPVIGIPGTIDNDIAGTDDTIGFDTAVNTALEAIDRIRDTASSHDRIFLIEVMGRSSGFIALHVGIGGGAETIVIPEQKLSFENIVHTIKRGLRRGKNSSIIVVAEGQKGGTAAALATLLNKRGFGAKVCILGHIQRGGTPSAHDRFLASMLGAGAVAHLLSGQSDCMIGVQDDQLVRVPFKEVVGKKKTFPTENLLLAKILGT